MELERYAQGLFDAFPDLRLELVAQTPASSGELAVSRLLFGIHQGALGECAPTGRAVVQRGRDFIAVRDGRIQSVVGYFSLEEPGTAGREVMRALGQRCLILPASVNATPCSRLGKR